MTPVVEVEALVPTAPEAGVVAHGMDHPRPGTTGEEFAVSVAGWVLGAPWPPLSVELCVQGRVVKTAPVALVRPGVAERFPDLGSGPSGYSTTLGVLGLPPRCRVEVVVVLADGTKVALGHFVVRHSPLAPSGAVRYQPLMVTSLGRMGTTWLMRLVSEHPSVVAHRSYPYEVMVGRYWAHQLRVLSAPADYAASGSPDTFAGDLWRVGSNPFYGPMVHGAPEIQRWLGRTHVEDLARFCRQSIDGFYGEVARAQGQDRDGFFAEKYLPDHVPNLMWDLYPDGRELVLVRDLRDVVCSMLAFNAKRGNQAFGREQAADDAEFVRNLARDMRVLRDAWSERAHRVHLVRYEDLVVEPVRVLGEALEYLGLDAGGGVVDAMLSRAAQDVADLDAHRTSAGPQASIGRWRRDLDPRLAGLCHEVMADTLVAFGYGAEAA